MTTQCSKKKTKVVQTNPNIKFNLSYAVKHMSFCIISDKMALTVKDSHPPVVLF